MAWRTNRKTRKKFKVGKYKVGTPGINELEYGEPMIVNAGMNEERGRIGIHLYNPTSREVENAIEDAQIDGFDRVYIHKEKK